MIFDAHSDVLYGEINYAQKKLLDDLSISDGGILNYYFKGSETHDDFLFVLQKIDGLKSKIPPFYILGIEGLGPMETIEELSLLKKAGIRSIMLTWNDENRWATGAKGNPKRGVTHLGKKLLTAMATMDFILDLSHANEQTFWDALAVFHGKVFVSHSNCFSLCPHERNISDAQILAIASRNGVIGVNAFAPFVGGHFDLDSYIEHLEYIRRLAGINVPCVGFDFDDYLSLKPSTISELSSKKDISVLIKRLKERGWSTEEIDCVMYKNISRFLNLMVN